MTEKVPYSAPTFDKRARLTTIVALATSGPPEER
jgi:hypothetical protein